MSVSNPFRRANDSQPQQQQQQQQPKKKNKEQSVCIRQIENWSKVKPEYIFDHVRFDIQQTYDELNVVSPKLRALFNKIQELDAKDLRETGTFYKHFIFTDLQGLLGSKIVASAFLAELYKDPVTGTSLSRYSPVFMQTTGLGIKFKRTPDEITPWFTFGIISSASILGQPFDETMKKKMLSIFNNREQNTQGHNMRFMIMDGKFKEGIDLFDVKYVHILEEPKTKADQKQTIGRATRYCGQAGLNFKMDEGWKLNVFKYVLTGDPRLEMARKPPPMMINGLSFDESAFMESIEKLCMIYAVDYQLNYRLHAHRLGDGSGDVEMKEPQTHAENVDEVADMLGQMSLNETNLLDLPLEKLQQKIGTIYKKLKYEKLKVNKCGPKTCGPDSPEPISLSNTQKFVSQFLTPYSKQKGMLLWHSVGTGKTCTAIAIKSAFEKRTTEHKRFNVLYVTRSSLVGEEQKNMYECICHAYVKDKLEESKSRGLRMRRADLQQQYEGETKDLVVQTITYKQFSNALLLGNPTGRSLQLRNGPDDLLKNTLVIIDEAHRLYGEFQDTTEKPDVDVITNAIHNSYEKSKENSCKVVLMTATPMVDSVYNFVNLMNLIIPIPDNRFKKEEFPYMCTPRETNWTKTLNCNNITPEGKEYFKARVKGLISYLDRSADISVFAQPVIKTIEVPMSKVPDERKKDACAKLVEEKVKECEQAQFTSFEKETHALNKEAETRSIFVNSLKNKINQRENRLAQLKEQSKQENIQAKSGTNTEIKKLNTLIKLNDNKIKELNKDIAKLETQYNNSIVMPNDMDIDDDDVNESVSNREMSLLQMQRKDIDNILKHNNTSMQGGKLPPFLGKIGEVNTADECEKRMSIIMELAEKREQAMQDKTSIDFMGHVIDGKKIKEKWNKEMEKYYQSLLKKTEKCRLKVSSSNGSNAAVARGSNTGSSTGSSTGSNTQIMPALLTPQLSPLNSAISNTIRPVSASSSAAPSSSRARSRARARTPLPLPPMASQVQAPANMDEDFVQMNQRIEEEMESKVQEIEFLQRQNQNYANNINKATQRLDYMLPVDVEIQRLTEDIAILKAQRKDAETSMRDYNKLVSEQDKKGKNGNLQACIELRKEGKIYCSNLMKQNEIYQDVQMESCSDSSKFNPMQGGKKQKMKKKANKKNRK